MRTARRKQLLPRTTDSVKRNLCIYDRRWRKRRKYRRWRRRERARVGIEPAAAAPSQPDCPGVSRSDHSAGSFTTKTYFFFTPPLPSPLPPHSPKIPPVEGMHKWLLVWQPVWLRDWGSGAVNTSLHSAQSFRWWASWKHEPKILVGLFPAKKLMMSLTGKHLLSTCLNVLFISCLKHLFVSTPLSEWDQNILQPHLWFQCLKRKTSIPDRLWFEFRQTMIWIPSSPRLQVGSSFSSDYFIY